MELDFVTSNLLEDETVEVGQNIGDMAGIEGERCGICMDIIIDRGVLDCCQHWFCFECIDNWSTIMNLCPLCQSEFQLITCVPVYDTGGSSRVGEDSLSRDEDWCIEGKSDALSSPSYYIDENAVICLDGDGCKIRNGNTCTEGDSNLDTSIACDSCDIWYHAFCVGFDPESASDDTWLCPRCLSNEKRHESDAAPTEPRNCQYVQENAMSECLAEDAFSGNFSVSVADDGETAIVVSMVKGSEWLAGPSEATLSSVQAKKNGDPGSSYLATSVKRDITKHVPGTEELKLPLSYAMSSDLSFDSKPSLLAEHGKNNADPAIGATEKECPLTDESKFLASAIDNGLDVASVVGVKRKHSVCSGNDDKAETENEMAEFLKKSRVEEKEEKMTFKDHENISVSNGRSTLPIQKQLRKVEDATIDILSIVKGAGRKPSKSSMHQSLSDKSSKEGENAAGLRVKKIMRKSVDDKESSVLVEKLRKEIREAVRNKSTKDLGENLFDPKLLAAFRAAVAGPKTEELPKKLSPVALKAKKSMLQKGKVRENLTKKIYADSNGKRRSAWFRDCEIEFWKHRCLRTTKPEKIETLKSVLSLLRKNTVNLETKPSSETPHASNPLLSRLYLADTSVFPRKDDIKPLSAFKETESSGNDAITTETDKASPKVSDAKGTNPKTTGSKAVSGSEKSHPNKRSDESSGAASGISKTNSQKETSEKSDDLKKDKRKWALEVLARKKALAGHNSSQDKQGDNAVLKGNFPLLAQLPTEMRPVLATSRHNKIPVSVRQAQLYRLTEHFLKKANLTVIRRTAATELAVADAINIEKAIADKSNSKVVYLNLCSQEILHHWESKEFDKTTESNSSSPPTGLDRSADEQSDDPTVQEALRMAGLLSDSPPNTPIRRTEVPPDRADDSLDKAKDEGPDNVFEIDSNPEADIYGDFEYDLDDEDYVGAKASEMQPEEGLSKVKVVLCTLKAGRSSNGPDVPMNEETLANLPCLLRDQTDTEIQNSVADGRSNKSCVPPEPLPEDEAGDLLLAECEELYGPDKEPPMIDRTLAEVSAENQIPESSENDVRIKVPDSECESNMHGEFIGSNFENSSVEEKLPKRAQTANHSNKQKEKRSNGDGCSSVTKKVEAYIKEHVRPLCKSGVINVDQYRWAVTKTTEKVMKYHTNAKNANFLIKEGEKVKKLAEQYVEAAAQQKEK